MIMTNTHTTHLFLIGVHRSGTTSMFRYLNAHQQVNGCLKKELHYFTKGIYQGDFQLNQEEYSKCFPRIEGILMEASPSYLYGGQRLAHFIKTNFEYPKCLLILRNPTDRFFSFYHHFNARTNPNERLEIADFVKKSKHEFESGKLVDNALNRALREGVYINYLPDWESVFGENLKLIYFENFIAQPKSQTQNIFDFLNLEGGVIEQIDFDQHNSTREGKVFFLHQLAMNVNARFEVFFRRNPRVKSVIKRFYGSVNEKKVESQRLDEIRADIEVFYAPFNKKLGEFLKSKDQPLPNWIE
jgi:hypothetical protein